MTKTATVAVSKAPRALAKNDIKLVVGGEPRAGLLPPEVHQRRKSQSTRRALVGVVVLAILVAGGGYGGSVVVASTSALALASEQERSTALLKKQGEFTEVLTVEAQLDAARAAQRVATSTEIDWAAYLGGIRTALPAEAVITHIGAEVATPLVPLGQATVPLQGPRVATLTLETHSPAVPDTARWLENLAKLPGFVDAMPGSISWNDGDEWYEQTITMHVDSRAFTGRFATEEGAG